MNSAFNKAIEAIETEREYQDALWGPTPSEGNHNTLEFLVYIRDYVETALHLCTQNADVNISEELQNNMRKITTLGVACMEQNGSRNRDVQKDLRTAHKRHMVYAPLEDEL